MSAEMVPADGKRSWRRWLIVAAIGLCLLFVLGSIYLWSQQTFLFGHQADVLTPANFERIAAGMTQAEVEAILGPWGQQSLLDFRQGGWSGSGKFFDGAATKMQDGQLNWLSGGAQRAIGVDFVDGKVVNKQKLGKGW
jgi:hypothetical protein